MYGFNQDFPTISTLSLLPLPQTKIGFSFLSLFFFRSPFLFVSQCSATVRTYFQLTTKKQTTLIPDTVTRPSVAGRDATPPRTSYSDSLDCFPHSASCDHQQSYPRSLIITDDLQSPASVHLSLCLSTQQSRQPLFR